MQPWKALIAFAVVVSAAAIIAWPYLFPRSLEAYVNAPVTVVRAPVAGTYAAGHFEQGDAVKKGQQLGMIRNEIVDSQFLEELRIQRTALASERDTVERELSDLKAAKATLAARLSDARARLGDLTDAAIAEQKIQIRLATTEIERVAEEVEMKRGLLAQDLVPINDFNRLVKELEAARLTKEAAQARLARLKIEAEAIDEGVGETGGGVMLPLEVRLLEYKERLNTLKARAQDLTTQLAATRHTLAREADRIHRMEKLPISSPISGRVWRIRARNRQFVDVGDSLAEMIQCERLVVSAKVSERTFNLLEDGRAVTFVSAASKRRYYGEIIQLQGPETGSDSIGFAIKSREEAGRRDFSMIIRLAEFPEGEAEPCPVGQTGKVYFSDRDRSVPEASVAPDNAALASTASTAPP